MTQERIYYFGRFAYLLLMFLVAACSNSVQFERTESLTEAAPPVSPTLAFTPSPTATATPSPLPPTWTPIPTLPLETAQPRVLELLETNRGCELPCWWGITPGETRWHGARDFLGPIAFSIYIPESYDNNSPEFWVWIQLPVPKDVYSYYYSHSYYVVDGIVEVIRVTPGEVPYYPISSFLSKYGPPTELWVISIMYFDAEGRFDFLLYMFYADRGILARFVIPGDATEETVGGCVKEKRVSEFVVWSPNPQLEFSEANRYFWDQSDLPFVLLSDVIDMDGKKFRQTYMETGSVCFETPREIWSSNYD